MDRLLFSHVAIIQPEVFGTLSQIRAGFSTRHGGVSTPPYHTLNLGLSTDDLPSRVAENRRRFLAQLGASPEQLAIAGQVHGTHVHVVDTPGLYEGSDALVTRTPDVVLGITAADCAVVLLADPTRGVIGACHAGWRGTVGGIVQKTVAAMEDLGARRSAIRAFISPCISVSHFEVGPEVARQFPPAHVHYFPARPRPHVDLKGTLNDQLLEAGLSPASIEVAPQCTVEHNELFYSHRAEQGVCGRMMGAIMMLPFIKS